MKYFLGLTVKREPKKNIMSRVVAMLVGILAGLGSPLMGGVCVLSGALILRWVRRASLVVDALLPMYVVVKLTLRIMAAASNPLEEDRLIDGVGEF